MLWGAGILLNPEDRSTRLNKPSDPWTWETTKALAKAAQKTIELEKGVLTHTIEALTRDVQALETVLPTLGGLRVNLQSIGVGRGLQEALASARELEGAQESVELALRELWANFHGEALQSTPDLADFQEPARVNLVNDARRLNLAVSNAIEDARKNLAEQEIDEVTLTPELASQSRRALLQLLTARSSLEKLAAFKFAALVDG